VLQIKKRGVMKGKIIEMKFKVGALGELDNDEYRFKILIDRLGILIKEGNFCEALKMMEENNNLYNRIRIKAISRDNFHFPSEILLIYFKQIQRIIKKKISKNIIQTNTQLTLL
jgi:hypothetical protein